MVSKAQKVYSNQGINFSIDMTDLVQALATGQAMSRAVSNEQYIDAVVDHAFGVADDVFNNQAIAMGQSGAISHMFEWGTIGINRGRTNVRISPDDPRARLWNTFTEGRGLDRTLWVAYRPSVANVPKPTKRDTNMDPSIIAEMRDHVFIWKAQVMEEGQTVTINPNRAKFLLIPVTEANAPYVRPNDRKRGYTLSNGPININFGQGKKVGRFTAFFESFWMGQGEEIVDASIEQQIYSDFEPEFNKKRSVSSLRPIGTFNVKKEVESLAKKIERAQIAGAKRRRMIREQ